MPARPWRNMVWSSASSTLIGPLSLLLSANIPPLGSVGASRTDCTVYAFRANDPLRILDGGDRISTVRPARSSGIHRSAWKGDSRKFALILRTS
jgi:hypothetical protein